MLVKAKRICVIGHFANGKNLLNGQTIKTKIVEKKLREYFGNEMVKTVDTHGGFRILIPLTAELVSGFVTCRNIIILPGSNGILYLAVMCRFCNIVFHRKLHYIVIGGWLGDFLEKHLWVRCLLRGFDVIYVETKKMGKSMKKMGFQNVKVMPNFKELEILNKEQIYYPEGEPFRLCTFSRVMREKGIEEAVNSVKCINNKYGRKIYSLDIYGQVEGGQEKWFEDLQSTFPEYIKYKGFVNYNESTSILKQYYALLFPTYYDGEGMAGTILDAMSSGLPVLASNWKYNSEFIRDGRNGRLFELKNQKSLYRLLDEYKNGSLNQMKVNCIEEAANYDSGHVMGILIRELKGDDF